MRKRGFTLIELLAVIVILAIIALIAVPVFLGIINNTKKSSDKEGVNLYTDTVEKAIQKKQMSDPNFMPDKCDIKRDGNLECFSGTTSLGTVKVSMKGTKPTSGTIYITEDDITYENIVLNGKTYYENKIATLVNDAVPTGVSIGDKYTYKVNDTDTFNFYVLSVEGDKVNLIMDRNICEDGTPTNENNQCAYAWYYENTNIYYEKNSKGPLTAMTALANGTRNWTNIPNIDLMYDNKIDNIESGYTGSANYGYNGMKIINGKGNIIEKDTTIQTSISTNDNLPIKARLPKLSELSSEKVGCHVYKSEADNGTCPTWLIENLANASWCKTCTTKYTLSNGITNIYGYWTLSSNLSASEHAYGIVSDGAVGLSSSDNRETFGIRPVITVPLSDLN